MNPLFSVFNTPFQTPPFSQIKNEHFKPAIVNAIAEARKDIDAIINNPETPTFKNTIEALDFSGMLLSSVTSVFFNLNSAETNDEIQKIAQEVSPILTEYSNDVALNEDLFKRVKAVYENNQERKDLTVEQTMLLDKTYKSFVRNGANLNEADKEKLRKIDVELSQLSLNFGENVLAETNKYELIITDKADLAGLPEGVVEAAAITAKSKNKEGWMFTLAYPSYIPFMTYAENRNLRQTMYMANATKSCKNDALDNQKNVLRIVELRYQRANLLGYKNHAHFVLEEQMAKTPEKVKTFLNDLLQKAKPFALKELNELIKFAQSLGFEGELQAWDTAFYREKLKQKLFDLDDEKLKPYFKLENVVNGVFQVAGKLYGLKFKEITNIDKYHPEVTTYEVTDQNNQLISLFYADFHPREGKRNGAWMTSFNDQYIKDGKNNRPHIVNVCNFTKPTETKPSLLTFSEVTTLFHEFGHALHGMLANTVYPSLSGTSVYRDFVELPSQVLENWCYEEEALKLFAKHYQTNEVIPIELIEKIKASANFMEATNIVRQLNFGILDMAWHTTNPSEINSVFDFENTATKDTQLTPVVENTCVSSAFSHIFQGGYSSGYYSYKWAEVLDADAFYYFKEHGIFNQEVANKFKNFVLSKGGSEHPMDLYIKFRGKEPDSNALLKRAGLLEERV
ncbi:MAG: Oligopeptidase A [Flavobacteriales bacterium]|nr:Oligopeptidase A [Flavobacteriales bacterium]